MRKSLLRFLGCSVLVSTLTVQKVQAQYWNLTGNNNATTASILGTTNSVPLNLYTKNVTRLTIDTLGRVGIGSNVPRSLLYVKAAGTTPTAAWINYGTPGITTFAEGTPGNGDFIHALASNSPSQRPVILARRSRGTLAAPIAPAGNDYVGSFYGSGFDGTSFHNAAGIDFIVDGAVAAGSVPTRISFSTGANASTIAERMKITWGGNFYFNNNQLTLSNATGDVNVGKGMIFFNNASQTIQFSSAAAAITKPMVSMFTAGTKASRLVLAPYATSTNVGLRYTQSTDSLGSFDFVGTRGSLMNITPYNKTVTVNDTLKASSIRAFGSHAGKGSIETFNYGNGSGIYAYTSGTGGISAAGVSAEGGGLSKAILAYAQDGVGVDCYSATNIGIGGTSGNHYGVYGYTENKTTYAGYFDGQLYATSIFQPSERKLKTDISDLGSGLQIINKLRPKSYEYRHDGIYKAMNLPEGKRYGLIAQELEEVLPNLVKQSSFDPKLARGHSKSNLESTGNDEEKIDFKAVNYTELIPIMIKGMQEQTEVIEAQKEKIDLKDKEIQDIKSELEQLKNMLMAKGVLQPAEVAQLKVKLTTAAQLDQNVPNPPVNNATTITYNIPNTSSKSEIVFSDITGKKVKQVALTNKGKGVLNVETAGLNPGTYTYSLYIDGQLIETKKMVVAGK